MSDPIIEELKIEEIEINSMEAEAKSRLTLLADFATYRVVAVGEHNLDSIQAEISTINT